MEERTKNSYRTRAKNFYNTINADSITPRTIVKALEAKALVMTPNSWRVLRNAIEFDQRDQGYNKSADKIQGLRNPTTTNRCNTPKNKVIPKVKSVSHEDEQKLFERLRKEACQTVVAVITLVKYLGCRPAELYDIDFLSNRTIHIRSAKKTKSRGLDRTVVLNGSNAEQIYQRLSYAHKTMLNSKYTDPVRYTQNRLNKIAKSLWPQRKKVPCLYSWRHQLGADLKASGKDRREIAAIMGHLSVESVSVYGRPRKARSMRQYLSANRKTIAKVKATQPTLPPSQRNSIPTINMKFSAKGGKG